MQVIEYLRSNNHTNSINIIAIKDKDENPKKLFDLIDIIDFPVEKNPFIFKKAFRLK